MYYNKCKKIVLTGGACSGKSESLIPIKEYFTSLGYNVYIVSEIATSLILGGILPQTVGKVNFQELIIDAELKIYDIYKKAINLSNNEKNLIIFDRCPIDCMMFLAREELDEILKKYNTSYEDIIYSYDGIIHFEPVYKKYPEMYTSENNNARRSEGSHTIETDNRLLEACKNHPNRVIVECTKDFQDKVKNAIKQIEFIITK